jgi:bifunctional NMN adenylyltransferase/nudix hydrolase
MSDQPSSIASGRHVAIVVGCFQPVHNGHLALLRHALMQAPLCVVVIGSAFQARSPTHPFTWHERAQMILAAVEPADRQRLRITPVRDHFLDERWATAVREAVDLTAGTPGARLLVGHRGIGSNDYLHQFADWSWCDAPWDAGTSAAAVRDTLFGQEGVDPESGLRDVSQQAPDSTVDFLRKWIRQPAFDQLKPEWQMLKDYQASWAVAPYPPILFTVDCVVRCGSSVLLIRRAHAPGKGLLGVPGGFMEPNESARQTGLRELEEETHLDVPAATLRACLKDAALFDRPGRSGRGRTVTHVHYFDLGDRSLPAVRADDDAEAVEWTPIAKLPKLEGQFMDDHFQMLDHFLDLELAAAPAWAEEEKAA